MSTAGPVQPTTERPAQSVSQEAHAHARTHSTAAEAVHRIAERFDERDWDAVMVLYHAGASLVRQRERERREREQGPGATSHVDPGAARLRQQATNNLAVGNKSHSPKKARSRKRKTSAKLGAKAKLAPAPLVATLTSVTNRPVARWTRSKSSLNSQPL